MNRNRALPIGLVLLLSGLASAQLKPTEPPRASSMKTPDGAIVFVGPNADDPDLPVEKIVLSAAEWKAFQEQLELAKRLAVGKAVAPSRCAIRVKIETRGEKPIAVLSVVFAVRTIAPRTLVALGLQKAQVTAARDGGERLPVLNPPTPDDGLTVLLEMAGQHTLTLDVEVAVGPNGKGELGFDVGLPRAAITTLTVEQAPATATQKVLVGTRTDAKVGELKRSLVSLDDLTRPRALGATDTLELTWEPPTTAPATTPTAEADVTIRVEDSQIETVAKLRLRGQRKEWQIALPAGADVGVTSEAGTAPEILRPTDTVRGVWTIRGSSDTAVDWIVIVTVRQPRPKPTEAKFRGPYPLGPFSILGPVRQSGRVNLFAPPTARLGFKAPAEFRRQDVPPDDGQVAAFQYSSLPQVPPAGKPPAWMDLDARLVPAVARVKPAHSLTLRSDGWHWDTTVKVVPPPRGEVESVVVELPAGWETLTAKPEDLIEEVQTISDGGASRSRLVRLVAPQKAPVELTLSSRFPLLVSDGKVTIPLPQFPNAEEREGTVNASVPEEFELRGSVAGEPLKSPATRRGPPISVSGEWDRRAERVELAWQPRRPDVTCETRADCSVGEQQTLVTQVLKFKSAGDTRPIRLRGPATAVGVKSVPAVDLLEPGEWEFRPPASESEFILTLVYALRHPPRKPGAVMGEWSLGLFAPVQSARIDSTVRIWATVAGQRLRPFSGNDWRELQPEPVAERDSLPSLTLTARGTPPLSVQWADATDTAPTVLIDRSLILVTLGDDGTIATRSRFLLRRWPANGVDVELPPDVAAEVLVDGKRMDPQPSSTNAEERLIRLVMPEPKAGRMTTLLEIRYSQNTSRSRFGQRTLTAPTVRSASYRNPVRWHLTAPPGWTTLFPTAAWQPDSRWGWSGYAVAPTATNSVPELEQWLTAGIDSEAEENPWFLPVGGDTLTARQAVPGRIEFLLLPRIGWIAAVSASVFLLGILLSRLRSRYLGPAVAGVGIAFTAVAAVAPQPAMQLTAAAQPGAFALALTLVLAVGLRWYAQRRIARLPSFSRSRSSSPVPAPTAATPSGPGRSDRGPSAEVQLELEPGSTR